MSAVENFPLLLSDAEEESSAVAPCFSHEGINVRSPLSSGLGWVVCVSCVAWFLVSPPPFCLLSPRRAPLDPGY